MAFKSSWIPEYEDNIIIQTTNTDAYLGWYKTNDIKVKLDFDRINEPETKKYIDYLKDIKDGNQVLETLEERLQGRYLL